MRVATNSMIQSALADLLAAQTRTSEANQQVATGKIAPDLKGYGSESQLIISERASMTLLQGYRDNNQALTARFEVQALAYEELDAAFNDLRDAIMVTDGTTLMVDVQAAFDRMVGAMNTKFAGKFVFSGMDTNTAPISATSIADLQAAVPDTDAVFVHSDRRETVKIDENSEIELNSTAKELLSEAFAIIERIADYDAGANGPLDGLIDNTQQTFLAGEIANLADAFDDMTSQAALNGATHARVERAVSYQNDYITYLEIIVGGLEDVDMAEAASALTQAQTAVEVSAAAFSTLSQVSLLNYI